MEQVQISLSELVKLAAVDSELYARTFHPNAFRKPSPPFSRKIWNALENPDARLVELLCFRGSAKTTRLRTFTAKRIAYGISRTILYVGASERDAIRSVQWLRGQVERNRFWADTFGLSSGRKWEETQIEIQHKTLEHPIWIVAAGMSGSLRGINFDDYRPDLIILDDPITDESASSEEQREKTVDLIHGAVRNSLAPATDEPNAKLAMAVTPQHNDDAAMRALRDPSWLSVVIPCWTEETLHEPVEKQESVWPEWFPSEVLRADKLNAIHNNKLSLWNKEMECRLTTPETSAFRLPWLNVYKELEKPEGTLNVLAIDPVPPPSDRQLAKALKGKDWEAQVVWGRNGGDYYCLDYAISRDHDPSWSIAKCFELARRYRVSKIVVESIAYQRVLKWILEQEMRRRGVWYTIIPYQDTRKKYTRITSVMSGLATNGKLYVADWMSEFITQFENYPNAGEHDDILDASSIALSEISNPYLERSLEDSAADVEEFPLMRACP